MALDPSPHVTRPCSRPSLLAWLPDNLAAIHPPKKKLKKAVTSDHIPAHAVTPVVAPCGAATAAPIANPKKLRISMIPNVKKVPAKIADHQTRCIGIRPYSVIV